jgi:uncharacterized protein with GYD domain
MARYLFLGKYSLVGLKGMSASRTKKALALIKKSGGKVDAMYALLGKYDLAFVVNFPGNAQAIKASIALTKLTGVGFITSPALTIEEFDRLVG